MAVNIAKLNVMLTGSAAGFVAAANRAKGALGSLTGAFSGAGAKMAALGGALGAGAAVYGLTRLVKSSIESIDTLKDQAEALGITTDALSRLQYATSFAGIESEALQGSLIKMLRNLDAATAGTGPAAEALAKLGLSANSLVAMSPEAAFAEIAEALSKVDNPAQKAALAMDLFGKQGAALIPTLNGGKDGLQAMFDEADKLGVTIKAVDAAKVEAAADAMQKVGSLITGIGNTLAIELAPYITAAANQLVGMGVSGEGMGEKVVSVLEAVAGAIAYVSDWLSLVESGFTYLQAGAAYAIGGILKAIDYLGSGLVDLLNMLPGVELEWGETIGAMADGVLEEAGRLSDEAGKAFDDFSTGATSDKVSRFFDRVRADAQAAAEASVDAADKMKALPLALDEEDESLKKITETLAKLRTEVEQFGMSAAEKLASELQGLGATPEQIKEAAALQEKLDALEAAKKAQDDLADAAKQMYDDTRTEAERYAAEVERINELLVKGLIDKDTAQRAANAAAKALADSQGDKSEPAKIDAPATLQAGSGAAASFVADIQRRQRGADKAELQLKELKSSNGYLKQMLEVAKTGGTTINVVSI